MYLEKQAGQSSIPPFILEILAPPPYQVTYLCTTLWMICCLQKGGRCICVAGKGIECWKLYGQATWFEWEYGGYAGWIEKGSG